MYDVEQTEVFSRWLSRLRDSRARARVLARLSALRRGHWGDARSLGGGLHELRIHSGPGYRVYFVRRGETLLLLLCGGDKGSQGRDIARARSMLASGRDGYYSRGDQRMAGKKLKITKFDASAYLDSEETIAAYLEEALALGDPEVFLAAVGDVAKARGMSSIARETGLGRASLYKAFAPGARPGYDTVQKVLGALGVKFTVSPL